MRQTGIFKKNSERLKDIQYNVMKMTTVGAQQGTFQCRFVVNGTSKPELNSPLFIPRVGRELI